MKAEKQLGDSCATQNIGELKMRKFAPPYNILFIAESGDKVVKEANCKPY